MLFYIEPLESGIKAVSFDGVSYKIEQPTKDANFLHFLAPLSVVQKVQRLGHRFAFRGPADEDAVKLAKTTSIGAPDPVGVPGAIITSAKQAQDPGLEPGKLEAVQKTSTTGLPGDPTAPSGRVPTPSSPPPPAPAAAPAAATAASAASSKDAPGESAPKSKA